MLKRSFKIFAWIIGVLVFLFGLTFGLLYFRQDQIRNLVFESINENLNSEISVKEAGISLRKFPKAAIRLKNVHAKGSHELGDTLFFVEDLFVEFSVWDMFGEEIPISSLSLEKGQLQLIEANGRNNWSIFKESADESSTAVKLEAIVLRQIDYRFNNESSQLRGSIEELLAQGQFAGENWALDLNLKSTLNHFEASSETYLRNKVILDGNAHLDGAESLKLKAKEVRFGTLENLQLRFENKEGTRLSLEHEQLDLAELKNIYAILELEWPEDISIAGQSQLRFDLIFRDNQELRTEVFAGISNLAVESPWYSDQDLEAQLEYYRQGQFDRLEIRQLKNGQGSRKVRGTIRQLMSPQLSLYVEISENQDFWSRFLPEDLLLKSGQIDANFDFKAQFKDWESLSGPALAKAQINGKLDFRDLHLSEGSNLDLEQVNAKARLINNSLHIDTLSLKRGESDLSLKGKIEQPLRFISDSTSILNARLVVNANKLLLSDFLSESETTESGSVDMAWKERLNLQSLVHLHEFKFRNFEAKELKGIISLNSSAIAGKNINLIADGGYYKGDFSIRTPKDSSYFFLGNLSAHGLNMASVFRSFDNFDQTTLTADNLDGLLSVDAQIAAPISPELELDLEGLEVQSEMTIEEGHLRDYEPMQALSRFAEVEELKDVQFNTLSNTITIAKGEIQIPEMTIASNVLNMELSGTHDFENQIDYVITMRLGDVLFAKRDKTSSNSEFEEHLSIQKRDDDHRIPIRISGSVDDPKINIDRESVSKSLKESLKQQGQEIRDLFKKEEKKEEQGTGLKFEWDEG